MTKLIFVSMFNTRYFLFATSGKNKTTCALKNATQPIELVIV